MIMYCPRCGKVQVSDESYQARKTIRESSLYNPLMRRYHSPTCGHCGLPLMETSPTPKPYDECESWPQCTGCSHYEWYMHDCVLMLDVNKPKNADYLKWRNNRDNY